MLRTRILLFLSLAIFWLGTHARPDPHRFNPDSYHPDDVITRDVLVVGGGSSGTFSAIQLRDKGKSAVVVETKNILGGHTETYTDPETHIPDNIGVIVYHDFDVVQKYFGRFQVPLTKFSFSAGSGVTKYADFRTGRVVAGYTPPNPAQAFATYAAQLAKYPYLETGFDLPDPVPADLLLPFRDFVTKYKLEDVVSVVFNFDQGYGNILDHPTVYALKVFGNASLTDSASYFLTAARGDNHELYNKALQELGSDALLNSKVVAIDRNPKGQYANIVVKTPSGKKLIRAKDILITVPPLLSNLHRFNLDDHERSVFRQFDYSAYYTGVLRNTGIPPGLSITNVGAEDAPYHVAALPGIYTITSTAIPGAFNVKYGSEHQLPLKQVKDDIFASVRRLGAAGTLNSNTTTTNATTSGGDLAIFKDHTPFALRVPSEAIKKRFYKDLYALQGYRRFWYTGATFHTHDSSLIWQFSEKIVDRIVHQ